MTAKPPEKRSLTMPMIIGFAAGVITVVLIVRLLF
jgi:hypothetical protein